MYVTLLPKSITTAIGMGVSEELGGLVTVTVAVIIITGVFGNIIGEAVFKIFHIKEAVAKGVALGTSAHAIGTPGDGTWRSRRSHEQSCHCGCGSYHGNRRVCFCESVLIG